MEPNEIDQCLMHHLFDYIDGHLYWKINRGGFKCKGAKAGRVSPYGYTIIEINGVPYQEHHLVWLFHYGKMPAMLDHIDGNRSNNKVDNLRECTRAQNMHNRKICKRNTVGVKGVRFRKDNKKYEARIAVNQKRFVLGSFDDLELAELVMQMAREKFHGAFFNHG
jgi:hypothetical protein